MKNTFFYESSENDILNKYSFYKATKCGNRVYFCANNDGSLCCYELAKKQIILVDSYIKSLKFNREPIEWIFSCDNSVIYITSDGNYAVKYDLVKRKYAYSYIGMGKGILGNYAFATLHNHILYIFPRSGNRFAYIDIDTMKIKKKS